MAACPKCNGSGILQCHRCNGSGKAPQMDKDVALNLTTGAVPGQDKDKDRCPSCHGVGTEPCSRCDGSGVVHC